MNMKKFTVSQFDSSTFIVVDETSNEELCICSDYDEQTISASERAKLIALALNIVNALSEYAGIAIHHAFGFFAKSKKEVSNGSC